jgi:cell division septal protein FtsQ
MKADTKYTQSPKRLKRTNRRVAIVSCIAYFLWVLLSLLWNYVCESTKRAYAAIAVIAAVSVRSTVPPKEITKTESE